MTDPSDSSLTDAWGIDLRYQDAFEEWHSVPEETHEAILAAMDVGDRESPPSECPVLFLSPGRAVALLAAGELQLESGGSVRVDGDVPANLPFGYHTLTPDDGSEHIRVIVTPDSCYLPQNLRTWGWAVQLYAARSAESWGFGDLHDLADLAQWSASELGAGMLMINPLHAPTPVPSIQPSPYYPSSRRYRNPLFLRIEDVPGAAESNCDIERLASMGRSLNSRRLIDRDAVFRLKMDALECLWEGFRSDAAFDEYCEREGRDLESFATFCAIAERHGGGWQSWPPEFRSPSSNAVRRYAAEESRRIRFHKWIQWLIDVQLQKTSYSLAIMQDLPIGVDPGGADAWAWQDVLATGVSVGAPPDKFNTAGQDWGLPPFIPWKLRAAGYEPFIQTIRATLRHAGGLRIDHVLGLFRLFWVPQGLGPAKGAYVRYNSDELLAVVALESHRANAFVVGEDLGTVEPGVSEKLQRKGILSYRVFWFEKDPPPAYPEMALSALSTHDLPTVAGMWTGSDLEAQTRIGKEPNVEETARSREALEKFAKVRATSPIDEVIVKAHECLAGAPSRILSAQLDDALAVEERPNMPATTTESWPNWSLALPKPLGEIKTDPLVRKVAAALARKR